MGDGYHFTSEQESGKLSKAEDNSVRRSVVLTASSPCFLLRISAASKPDDGQFNRLLVS
jgi:hypothetical protein